MVTPHWHKQNAERKSEMATTIGCYVLFWANPGSSTLQNSWTAIYLPSHEPPNQDMVDAASEVRIHLVTLHMDTAVLGRPAKTYIHLFCLDTECRLENLPRTMIDRNWWWEKLKGIRAVDTPWYVTTWMRKYFAEYTW